MPVLLGLSLQDLSVVPGTKVLPHSQGVSLHLRDRGLIREVWEMYYPHWQLNLPRTTPTVVRLLTKYNLTLALAESCTGGGIASALADIPGASRVLLGGVVAYSPRAKSRFLGLKEENLPQGCVEKNLTKQMAEQVKSNLNASIGLGITGALGPQSPADHISIGSIYIAIAGLGCVQVSKFNFSGDRQTIKKAAINAALNNLLTYLARWYVA